MMTLRETLEDLAREGYRDEFAAVASGLRDLSTGKTYAPADVVAERVARVDVDTDPDDQVIVYAVRATADGARGTYVAAFGPVVDDLDAAIVTQLSRLPR